MRKQYHLRPSEKGLLAWDVDRLVELTSNLSPIELSLSEIQDLDENFWFATNSTAPTCRNIAMHAKLIEETELRHPIIVDPENRVMDGMHRVCKALNQGLHSISAFRLTALPDPDFIGIPEEKLPYPKERTGDSDSNTA